MDVKSLYRTTRSGYRIEFLEVVTILPLFSASMLVGFWIKGYITSGSTTFGWIFFSLGGVFFMMGKTLRNEGKRESSCSYLTNDKFVFKSFTINKD